MNNKKMVFFVPNLTPRPNRRIQEFIDAGFDCEVYCMSHSEDIVTPRYKVTYLNENKLSKMSYPRRMLLFSRQIGSVVDRFDKKKTLFYFFSFNTAFLVLLRRNLQFIYEESDMLFDRFSSSFLQNLIIKLNRKIISKSGVTVFTSEGFAHFYYNRNIPKNIVFVPNKVDKRVLELPVVNKHEANFSHLKFGFVGSLRYETLRNFAYVLIKNFPSAQFDFYGRNSDFSDEQIEKLKSTGRIFFHGTFTNPDDLPQIYSELDFAIVNDAPALRRLAVKLGGLKLLCLLVKCTPREFYAGDACANDAGFPEKLWQAAAELDLLEAAPQPFLMGKMLMEMGFKPGKQMGELIKQSFELQLDGKIKNAEEAIAWVRSQTKERL